MGLASAARARAGALWAACSYWPRSLAWFDLVVLATAPLVTFVLKCARNVDIGGGGARLDTFSVTLGSWALITSYLAWQQSERREDSIDNIHVQLFREEPGEERSLDLDQGFNKILTVQFWSTNCNNQNWKLLRIWSVARLSVRPQPRTQVSLTGNRKLELGPDLNDAVLRLGGEVIYLIILVLFVVVVVFVCQYIVLSFEYLILGISARHSWLF